MKKIFKTIDERFAEIGFVKLEENKFCASYERLDEEYNFTQRLDLLNKKSGRHLIQSYDLDLMDEKKIGNVGVGLTMYEAKLCIKKMKKMGWKVRDGKYYHPTEKVGGQE